jgi:hypothetical protein
MKRWKIIVIVLIAVIALVIGVTVGIVQKKSPPSNEPLSTCPIQASQRTSDPAVENQGYCGADGYEIAFDGGAFGLVESTMQPGPYTMQTCIDKCNGKPGCTGFTLTAETDNSEPYWPCWGFSDDPTTLAANLKAHSGTNVGIKMVHA